MSDRQRLPNRRVNRTEVFTWKDKKLLLAVGFDASGRVREVFVKGTKAGTDTEVWTDHSCILVSYLLQSGHDVEGLMKRLGIHHRADTGYAVPSLIEAVLAAALEIEREDGAGVREFLAAAASDRHYLYVIETNDVNTDDSKIPVTWVVERYINNRLCYWAPGARGRASRDDWAEDFSFAVRFSDMGSAEMVMVHAGGGEGRIRAHRLIGRNTPAPC